MLINKQILVDLIDRNEKDKSVQSFIYHFPERVIKTNDELKRKFYCFYSSGIELCIENDKINTIFLFTRKTNKYKSCISKCTGDDIFYNSKKEEIFDKLGNPSMERAKTKGMFGIEYAAMIRYDYDSYSVAYDFDDSLKVIKITISVLLSCPKRPKHHPTKIVLPETTETPPR